MVDVFISYSRENQAVVRQLADAVTAEGYSVWWDDELPPHLSYGDVIAEKIGSARAAIVVWSHSAVISEWVRAEADVARNQKKLIQTSVDDRLPPMPFNQIQCASIGDWRGEPDHPGWRKVKASLAALCGPRAAAATAAPVPAPPRSVQAPPAALPAANKPKRVPVLLGLFVLALLAAGYWFWSRGGSPPPVAPAPAASAPSESADPAPEPREKAAAVRPRGPRTIRELRRYCAGPGRGTPECRRLRERGGR